MTSRGPSLVGTLVAYTLARLGLVAVVAGLLVLAGVPLLLALLVGVIAALPLSMLLLRGLRERLDALSRRCGSGGRPQREVLRARLRGDDLPDDGPSTAQASGAERQADAGEHRPGQQ